MERKGRSVNTKHLPPGALQAGVVETVKSPKRPFSDTQEMFARAQSLGIVDALFDGLDTYDRNYLLEGVEMLGAYLNTEASLKEVGMRHRASRDTVRKQTNQVIARIINSSPDWFQELYKIDSLGLIKPTTNTARLNISQGKGGINRKLQQSIALGTTPEELLREFDLTTKQLVDKRKKLRKAGVEIPHIARAYDSIKEIEERLARGNLTDMEAQYLLDKVTLAIYRGHHGKNDFLAGVKDIVERAGMNFKNPLSPIFAKPLVGRVPLGVIVVEHIGPKGEKVPQINRFIFRYDLNRAAGVLKRDASLQKYKAS